MDGHVKFWKKMPQGIEFVKNYRAHMGPVRDASVSWDGTMLVTIGADNALKLFDVVSFDMINLITLPFSPTRVALLHRKQDSHVHVAMSVCGGLFPILSTSPLCVCVVLILCKVPCALESPSPTVGVVQRVLYFPSLVCLL